MIGLRTFFYIFCLVWITYGHTFFYKPYAISDFVTYHRILNHSSFLSWPEFPLLWENTFTPIFSLVWKMIKQINQENAFLLLRFLKMVLVALSSFLLYRILQKNSCDKIIAAIIAGFYALSPLLSASIVWTVSSSIIFANFFAILSWYLVEKNSPIFKIGSLFVFVLALFTHVSAAAFPLLYIRFYIDKHETDPDLKDYMLNTSLIGFVFIVLCYFDSYISLASQLTKPYTVLNICNLLLIAVFYKLSRNFKSINMAQYLKSISLMAFSIFLLNHYAISQKSSLSSYSHQNEFENYRAMTFFYYFSKNYTQAKKSLNKWQNFDNQSPKVDFTSRDIFNKEKISLSNTLNDVIKKLNIPSDSQISKDLSNLKPKLFQ